MGSHQKLVNIALSGPLRRTFTYHINDDTISADPGQRVLVEFGRRRTLGFYLGESSPLLGVTTKPVIRTLDATSRFPRELFDLCLWMADYYFANPADTLTCALPPALKSQRGATLKWTDTPVASLPSRIEPFFRAGNKLTPAQIDNLRRIEPDTVANLIKSGTIVELWPESPGEASQEIGGYRAAQSDLWPEFFKRRRFRPEPFDNERDRADLLASGWTDHYLKAAVGAGLLEPVYAARADSILNFVKPKEGVVDLAPNSGQQAAVDALRPTLGAGFAVSLLHGITGSGKTLVYCLLAREVIERGKTVLVLTPEIALSGATLAYFRGFFGDIVTVVHSAMTPRERNESWRGVRDGKYRIVVGPRSALFAPLENLGLIVVDEEHDSSYKQADPSPRFHGRDCAIMRGKLSDVPVLLGSASPSLESYHHARSGRYRLLTLDERPAGAELPRVTVIDLRTQKLQGDTSYLSFELKHQIDLRLQADQQVILFLNRRGYSPQLKCAACGHVPACPHCEIKLTYHKIGRRLSCHYCGHATIAYDVCEKCSSNQFLYPGTGTQKVEEHVARLFKQGKVLRFDSDTASGRKNGHKLLHEFASREYNLLLGTQMVTKGLDLPGVTLVGVLSADIGIDLPDLRANEKTFSRLLQVAGRSGRGQDAGDVFIQTYYPESGVIADAARQDYVGFFEREIESRRELGYPPFGRLIRFVFSAVDKQQLEEVVAHFDTELRRRATGSQLDIQILGPTACPIALLRGRARRHLIVKTAKTVAFIRMLTEWEAEKAKFGLPGKVRVAVDVDPDDMM